MILTINERTLKIANYIVDNKCTVREAAKVFGIGKSTLHKNIVERLPDIDNNLYQKVVEIFDTNFKMRHIRGGESTKEMYRRKREEKQESM